MPQHICLAWGTVCRACLKYCNKVPLGWQVAAHLHAQCQCSNMQQVVQHKQHICSKTRCIATSTLRMSVQKRQDTEGMSTGDLEVHLCCYAVFTLPCCDIVHNICSCLEYAHLPLADLLCTLLQGGSASLCEKETVNMSESPLHRQHNTIARRLSV